MQLLTEDRFTNKDKRFLLATINTEERKCVKEIILRVIKISAGKSSSGLTKKTNSLCDKMAFVMETSFKSFVSRLEIILFVPKTTV